MYPLSYQALNSHLSIFAEIWRDWTAVENEVHMQRPEMTIQSETLHPTPNVTTGQGPKEKT